MRSETLLLLEGASEMRAFYMTLNCLRGFDCLRMGLGLGVDPGLAVEGGSDGFHGGRPPEPLKHAG